MKIVTQPLGVCFCSSPLPESLLSVPEASGLHLRYWAFLPQGAILVEEVWIPALYLRVLLLRDLLQTGTRLPRPLLWARECLGA